MQVTNKQKVLIVDDERFNINILVDILKTDYNIIVAKNGKQAIMRAISNLPDIILLDIIMPEMDGFEVCKNLKGNEQTKDIPIIFISALGETQKKVKCFSLGGVDYITKPFRAEEVLARVKTHLMLRMMQKELEEKNAQLESQKRELEKTIAEITTLRGILPICSNCKKIRDDKGYWNKVENYIVEHSDAKFSHGLCPDCMRKLYPKQYEKLHERGVL